MNEPLVTLAIQYVPDVVRLLKRAFMRGNANTATPTDAEVIAAYQQALTSSLAKDAMWLASHPET